ncbi:hypothetical protein [Streptomyces mirabilis]
MAANSTDAAGGASSGTGGGMPYMPMGGGMGGMGAAGVSPVGGGERSDASGLLSGESKPWERTSSLPLATDTVGADGGTSAGGASLDLPGGDKGRAPENEQVEGMTASSATGVGTATEPDTTGGMPYMPMGGAAQNGAGERSDASGLLSLDSQSWSPSADELAGYEGEFAPGAVAGTAALNLPQSDGQVAAEPGAVPQGPATEPFVTAPESGTTVPEVSSEDTAVATVVDDGFVASPDQTQGVGIQGGAGTGDPWDVAAGSLLLSLLGPGRARGNTEDAANAHGGKGTSYEMTAESAVWASASPAMPTWRPGSNAGSSAVPELDEGEVSMAAAMQRIEQARQRISLAADKDAARAAEAEKAAQEEPEKSREEGARPTAVAHLLQQDESQWGGSRASDPFS